MYRRMMNFDYTEEQLHIAESAKNFSEKYIRPHIMEWDEAQTFPVDLMKKAGEYGFLGVFVPVEYGGSGLGYHEYIAILLVIQPISKLLNRSAVIVDFTFSLFLTV